MKTNKIYIIAVICLLAGIVTFAIGFTIMGFDITKFNTDTKYVEKEYVSTQPVEGIVIDDNNISIQLITSNDENVHITYYDNEKEYYDIDQSSNGTLNVIRKNISKWYDNFFNMNFQTIKLTVAIPSEFQGDIFIDNSNGNINLADINGANVTLVTSNAKIVAKNVTALEKFKATTSNGNVALTQVTASDDIVCKTSNSEVSIEKVKGNNINLKTSNGRVTMQSVSSNEAIIAKASNGSIKLDKIEFNTGLDCDTSNGSISGNIIGNYSDYNITSRTSNGENNLPEYSNEGTKDISITTSNGDIDIDFSE